MTDLIFTLCFVFALLLSAGLCWLTYTSVRAEPAGTATIAVPEPDTTEEDTQDMPVVDPDATKPIRWWWN